MERNISQKIAALLGKYKDSPDATYCLIEHISGNLSGFHQWADGKPSDGAFLFRNGSSKGVGLWVLLLMWNPRKSDYYLVIFPETKLGPLAEIHHYSSSDGAEILSWRYVPKKQDKNNSARKAHFAQAFLSGEAQISVPQNVDDIEGFLDELYSLVDCRIKADELNDGIPLLRTGFPEGKLKEKLHLSRERNAEVIRQAKLRALQSEGKLTCACCGFDFNAVYGQLGKGFIEAHHTTPISELHENGEETQVEDLVLVCSNCHRMLHRRRPWLKIDQLSELVERRNGSFSFQADQSTSPQEVWHVDD
jgi:hypothetical protein